MAILSGVTLNATCGHRYITTFAPALDQVAAALIGMPPREARWMITAAGVGPVQYGDALSALSGPGFTPRGPGCEWASYRADSWSVSILSTDYESDDVGFFSIKAGGPEVPTTEISDAPATATGITLGSSLDKLLAAHPDAVADAGSGRQVRLPNDGYEDYVITIDGVPVAIGTHDGYVDVIMPGLGSVPWELC